MAETIYVKYNGTRRKDFQIKTAIRLEQGEKTVDKTALCPEGEAHIRSFEEKYRLLSEESGRLTFLKPEIRDGGRTARFPFLTGDTLSKRLGEAVSPAAGEAQEDRRERVKQAVKEALDTAVSCRLEYVSEFNVTPEFLEVFGQPAAGEKAEISSFEEQKKAFEEAFGEQETSFRTANADALFDNVMMCRNPEYEEGGEALEEIPIALDYEWVFPFPVPVSFLKYRVLFYFYVGL